MPSRVRYPLALSLFFFFFLFFHKPRARARGMRHFDQGLTTLFLFSGLVGASQWFNADMTSFPHERDHSAPKQQGV